MGPSSLEAAFARIGETQPHPSGVVVAGTGILALLVVAARVLFLLVERADAMAHEGAHAVFALLLGGSAVKVDITRSGGGLTSWRDRSSFTSLLWMKDILVGFVGYLGPTAAGVGMAKLIQMGHPVAALWAAVALLIALLVLAGGARTVVYVVVAGGVLALIGRYGDLGVQAFTACFVAWLLIFAGVRTSLAVWRYGSGDSSDLRAGTWVPQKVWALLWVVGSFLGLVVGTALMFA